MVDMLCGYLGNGDEQRWQKHTKHIKFTDQCADYPCFSPYPEQGPPGFTKGV